MVKVEVRAECVSSFVGLGSAHYVREAVMEASLSLECMCTEYFLCEYVATLRTNCCWCEYVASCSDVPDV